MARRGSNASSYRDATPERDQELSTMYDYLAKIILIGPSGSGKSCLLHRFVKGQWRVLTSQTIGVEFASKIVRVGNGPRRQRFKLQLWDTAGTERFRSVSRSYYRGAAGAILVYDISSRASFQALATFLNDARALAGPNLTVVLAGNKTDIDATAQGQLLDDDPAFVSAPSTPRRPTTSSSSTTNTTMTPASSFPTSNDTVSSPSQPSDSFSSNPNQGFGARLTSTVAPQGREVSTAEAARWAAAVGIPMAVEVSACDGNGVEELFNRLARTILTKIELGDIDPDDPASGIQYGDGSWGFGEDAGTVDGSIRSGLSSHAGSTLHGSMRKRGRRRGGPSILGGGGGGSNAWGAGLLEWEEVFRLDGRGRRSRGGCC